MATAFTMQYELSDGFDYEPSAQQSIAYLAEQAGVSGAEYAYDLLMSDGGRGFIYFPLLNYADGNLNFWNLSFNPMIALTRYQMAARTAGLFATQHRPPSCCSTGYEIERASG